jgi:multidrug efflux pump
VIASGASSKSQQALGTGVMGGMIAVVVLALIMVPAFFVVVRRLFARGEREAAKGSTDSAPPSQATPAGQPVEG